MQITSVDEVIEVLGGYRHVSDLVNVVPSAALNWKARKSLPKRTFVILTDELTRRGHTAPPSLWGIDTPDHHYPTRR